MCKMEPILGEEPVEDPTGEQWLLIWWKHAEMEYGVYKDSYLDTAHTERDLMWQPSTRVICKALGGLSTKNKLKTHKKYMGPFQYALAKEFNVDLDEEESDEGSDTEEDDHKDKYVGRQVCVDDVEGTVLEVREPDEDSGIYPRYEFTRQVQYGIVLNTGDEETYMTLPLSELKKYLIN